MHPLWGCYDKAERGRWAIYCPSCLGSGCEECGNGEIVMSRCPNSFDRSNVIEIFTGFTFFNNYSVLPNEGGFVDQSDNFHKVISLANRVNSLIEKEKQKRKK